MSAVDTKNPSDEATQLACRLGAQWPKAIFEPVQTFPAPSGEAASALMIMRGYDGAGYVLANAKPQYDEPFVVYISPCHVFDGDAAISLCKSIVRAHFDSGRPRSLTPMRGTSVIGALLGYLNSADARASFVPPNAAILQQCFKAAHANFPISFYLEGVLTDLKALAISDPVAARTSLAELRRFFVWLRQHKLLRTNPLRGLKIPAPSRRSCTSTAPLLTN